MITLEDYANVSSGKEAGAFGTSTLEELNQLEKALEAGQLTGRDLTNLTGQSGAPLKVESLDKTLKVLTYKESDIVFWKRIPKSTAFNTVEEYNEQRGYGSQASTGFIKETETPDELDSDYVRRAQYVKFLGTVRSVSLAMTLVNTMIGSSTEKQIKDGTLWILRNVNRALYYGDSALVPDEFNGILAQQARSDVWGSLDQYMNSEVVIDLGGKAMNENVIEDAVEASVENFGLIDQMYAPPKVISKWVQRFYGNKFISVNGNNNPIGNASMGQRVRNFESQFGDVGLNKDIFFNKFPNKTLADSANSNRAALAPTAGSVTPVASDTKSKFTTTRDAGNYFYAVSAWNRYGESALTLVDVTVATIANGGSADLVFTNTTSPNPATAFMIYRSDKGATDSSATTFHPLFKVSATELANGYDGGTSGTVRDRDRWMADCDQAMLIQEDTEVVEFKQLAPLMKLDLAITGPAYRFMVLQYGTPFLYAQKKVVRIINIGQSLT